MGATEERDGAENDRACGAIPPNVGGPVPCHLEPGHAGDHFSTSGCAGSEIRWPVEHDHTGPDWRCEACRPLADVLRARMRWASVHWGNLHDDAWPSLARAIHEAGYARGTQPTEARS